MALLAIFSHGPMPMFSTRTLAVAWEMWAHGHWLVPHINGDPYSEKVPLLFWMIHAGWAVFGVNDVWPRILEVNINGSYVVFEAARRAGTPRVIFASSNHAVGFAPRSAFPVPD